MFAAGLYMVLGGWEIYSHIDICSTNPFLLFHFRSAFAVSVFASRHVVVIVIVIVIVLVVFTFKTICILKVGKLLNLNLEASVFEILLETL